MECRYRSPKQRGRGLTSKLLAMPRWPLTAWVEERGGNVGLWKMFSELRAKIQNPRAPVCSKLEYGRTRLGIVVLTRRSGLAFGE